MAIDQWTGQTDGSLTTAGNWKSGAALVNGDAALFPKTATQDGNADLDVSAVTLVGFEVEKDCSVSLGKFSAADLMEYAKFTLLHAAAYYNAILRGSGESWLHFTNYALIHVAEAPDASSSNYGMNLTGLMDGTGAGKILVDAPTGTVGIAANPDEVMECEEIKVIGATVTVGEGTYDDDGSSAVPLIEIQGGTVTTRCAVTTLDVDDCEFRHEGGNIGTLDVKAGEAVIAGVNTITAAYVRGGAKLDMTGDLQAKTLTDVYMGAGAELDLRGSHVTVTNGVTLQGCGLHEVSIYLDAGDTLSIK